MSTAQRFSVAIPHFNQSNYLADALALPLASNSVADVVVVDDASSPEERSAVQALVTAVRRGDPINAFATGRPPWSLKLAWRYRRLVPRGRSAVSVMPLDRGDKLRVVALDRNVGAYQAKMLAVARADTRQVVLLDADNFLTEASLPVLERELSTAPLEGELWLPNVLLMDRMDGTPWDHWNHRLLGYDPIDTRRVAATLNGTEGPTARGVLLGMLNTGNFVVNRDEYTEVARQFEGQAHRAGGADVLAFVLGWLATGRTLRVIPGYFYFHRTQVSGFWKRNRTAGTAFQDWALSEFLSGRYTP